MKIIKRETPKSEIESSKKFFFENYDPEIEINISETARSFGVSRPTLYKWIKEMK